MHAKYTSAKTQCTGVCVNKYIVGLAAHTVLAPWIGNYFSAQSQD